jgi:hypothetical protein
MQKTRQNVTLVVEEDLLLAARKVALDRRTSVNQLVRSVGGGTQPETASPCQMRKASKTGLVEVGSRTWSRNDLYDR